jgi:anti-sigma regulatory factor (Ser/Thr protein kinase)
VTTVERTISNDAEGVAQIALVMDALGAAQQLPAAAVTDMQVALDEVLTNIVNHAHSDRRPHDIRVRLTVTADALEAEIEDDGRPFDPLSIPPPDLGAPLRERAVGGLGIHFARHLMSEVRYTRADNRNHLVLRKLLTDQTEADTRGPS